MTGREDTSKFRTEEDALGPVRIRQTDCGDQTGERDATSRIEREQTGIKRGSNPDGANANIFKVR